MSDNTSAKNRYADIIFGLWFAALFFVSWYFFPKDGLHPKPIYPMVIGLLAGLTAGIIVKFATPKFFEAHPYWALRTVWIAFLIANTSALFYAILSR
jgi:hypothetical protein